MLSNRVSLNFKLQDSFLSFHTGKSKDLDAHSSLAYSTPSSMIALNSVHRESEKGIPRRAFITTPTTRSPKRNGSPRIRKDDVVPKFSNRSASMPKIGSDETKFCKILPNNLSPLESYAEGGPSERSAEGAIKNYQEFLPSPKKSPERSFQLPQVRIASNIAALNKDEKNSALKQPTKELGIGDGRFINYLNFLHDTSDPVELREFRSRLSKHAIHNRNKQMTKELRAVMKNARKASLPEAHFREWMEGGRRASISPVPKNEPLKSNEVTLFGRNLALAPKDRKKNVLFGIQEGDSTTKFGDSPAPEKSIATPTNDHLLLPIQVTPSSDKYSKQNLPFSMRSSLNGKPDFSLLKRCGTNLSLKKMPEGIYEISKPIDEKLAKELAYNLHTLATTNLNEMTVETIIREMANKDSYVLALLESKSHKIHDYDYDKLVRKFCAVRVLNEGIFLLDWKISPPLIDIPTLKKVKLFLDSLDEYNTTKKIENLKALEDTLIKSSASTITNRKELLRKIGNKSEKAVRIHQEIQNLHGTVNLQHLQVKDISKTIERHEFQNGEIREVLPRNRIIGSRIQDLVQNYVKFSLENAWEIGK